MIAIRSAPTSVPRAPSAPRARGSPGRATTRANASARRRAVVVPPSASSSRSVAAASASASTATASATYELRPDAVPSTQRASSSSAAPPELVLYRDTNAWCPFCERVWLALEAKGVSYTCEFVDLRRVHPKWFTDLVPTGLVPAARFAADDALVWESMDILRELETRFPDAPALTPADEDGAAKMEAFIAREVEGAFYLTLVPIRPRGFGAAKDPEDLPKLRAELEVAVARAKPHFANGFIVGDAMTTADVLVAPALERLAANLLTFRGYDLRCVLSYTAEFEPWFLAMEATPAYRAVMGDPETHNTVVRQLFGLSNGEASLPPPPASVPETPTGAKEAGTCLSNNMDAVVADALKNSGVDADADDAEAIVRTYLETLAASLLADGDGDGVAAARPIAPHPRPARAMGAATLAFVRNRVSAPRDMSAHAAVAFRAAADAFLTSVY
ncbi:uncharacterized protein MICPUCDRAFT_23315 [Micromonas pusilla CCMP1545]|uniref:Predicted protein n=1 Tax=Micromonas pusilla (strain CCMP1545) TaxID=564608 RepID=C1N7S7_MICPC|nr:uncharacterized protein MICPUCDRAFT_23315 [Micromonas pusilla CCMP1545]EEH51583.1 predicted protein [Micromonas pusilla CCMP1545]|eukprot:XP_003063961.1 predicted protein [Micromonas pusilla CCMP1545]